MRLTKRAVALLLTVMLVLTALPLSVFATGETVSASGLTFTGITDDTNGELTQYKQYETTWTESTYIKADVKLTVYFDTENATETRDVIFYVINWNDEGVGRIGTDSDTKIILENIKAEASVESGNRAAVIVVDYGGNENAVAETIEYSMATVRAAFADGTLDVWKNPTAAMAEENPDTTTITVSVHKNHVYVLPAGYNLKRDVLFFETDVHASLGTLNHVMSSWNTQIAYNPDDSTAAKRYAAGKLPKAVNYAWHTGDANCTCTANGADNECYAGAPQTKNGEVIPYTNIITHTGDKTTCEYPHSVLTATSCKEESTVNVNWAPVVSRVEDCVKSDGSPMDYNCRLDIIYPSGTNVAETPVFAQAATQSPRMTNIGTLSTDDYDKDGVASVKARVAFVGFTFSGYTGVAFDYAYVPMARGDHYGYIDNYGTHWQNGAKVARAAIRCVRYWAEKLGYSSTLIGAAGISKGTPTTSVLSTVNNKYVVEQSTFKYTIDGVSTETRGLYYEGDLNEDGSVTEGQTDQPYMSYDQGYKGTISYNEDGTVKNEISSEVSVVYCAAGDGINWTYSGNNSTKLGASYTYTADDGTETTVTTQHVPMILSCGYYDEYGCWDHFDDIQARFTQYAENPFLAIPMEDMGHDYPSGIDPLRGYDRYHAFVQFFHSILNPDLYEAQVAWMLPNDEATDVSLSETIRVQLVKPTDNINDVTVTDNYGNTLEGTWKTNDKNTSGLYTFVPTSGTLGGTTYTVTVPTTVVATEATKSFTTEAGGVLRPIADTYVSAADADAKYGTADTVTINNQNFYLATFKTADFEDANKATLNLPLTGSASQEISVYLVDNYTVDEATLTYNTFEEEITLTDDMLIGTYTVSAGNNKLTLKDIIDRVSGENFTLVLKGSANYLELDFEEYTTATTNSSTNRIPTWNSVHDSAAVNSPKSLDDCFSTYYVGREAGSMPDIYAYVDPADSNNKVAAFTTSYNYNRLKLFNSFVRDKSYLTDEDLGKVFDISYDIRVSVPDGVTATALQIQHGISEANSTNIKDSLTTSLTADTWKTVTDSITITQAMVDAKSGMLILTFNSTMKDSVSSSSNFRYYIDDIVVTERAPTTMVSRENTTAMTAYITTETAPEGQPLADAYVSALEPDTAFGEGGKLMLNGGDDENILFLTFPASILEGKDYLDLRLPVQNDAGVEVEVYLLDGYYVDESTLTYNNMPDLSGETPIGTYTIVGGKNTLELDLGEDDVEKTSFTLVLKATETSCHSYYEDFESYTAGTQMPNTSTASKTETDADTESTVNYYYGYSDTYFFRGGSGWNQGSLVAAVDPDNENNMVLKTSTSSGRARLMNALSHDDLTEDDLNKTYRFSFKVKDVDATAGAIQYGIMEANGYSKYYSRLYVYSSDANPVTNTDWRTVTVDYKLSEVLGTAGVTATNNPMLYIESVAYYYDDISVIELNDDGTEKRVMMSSNEGSASSADVISFRTRTVNDPIADTYVSAIDAKVENVDFRTSATNVISAASQKTPDSDKNVAFGQREDLYISGASSDVGERVTLLSYSKEAVADGDIVILNLPTTNDTAATINIYLLDGYKLDEDKMTYALYESEVKNNMTLVGSATLTKGNNKIELNTNGAITSDYFTLILCAAEKQDHIYVSDFEKWEAGTTGNSANTEGLFTGYFYGYDSTQFKDSSTTKASLNKGDFIGYSSNNFYARGGEASYGSMTVVADPDGSDNKVLQYKIGAKGPRIKLLNTMSFDTLTEADVGKTYRFSFRIKAIAEDGKEHTQSNTMGALRMYGSSYESNSSTTNNSTAVKVTTNGEWHEFTYDYVVKSDDIVKNSAATTAVTYNDPVFAIIFASNSSTVIHYYLDDITVVKLDENGKEPVVTVASAENSDVNAALPSVAAQNSLTPVADTYVSRVNPDTVYGNENVLKLGDADGDKKVMVLSFMNRALDESNYVQLNLPNGGDTLKDVSVYYVMNYLADETSLTWNTMPDYEDNLLGTYDIKAGENKIDVSSLRDKLEGTYFTLIFRTENHSFGLNFERYSSTQTFSDGKDNNVSETVVIDNVEYTYTNYHGFTTEAMLENGDAYTLSRRGGLVRNRKIAVDPDDPDNQVLAASTDAEAKHGGRLKFYNSISYFELTEKDVRRTFRFTVRVRGDNQNTAETMQSKYKVTACAQSAYGTTNYAAATATASELKNGWVTLTVDYTIESGHVKAPMSKDGKYFYSYPMFTVDFGDDNSATESVYYLIDDISVVELIDGEPIGEATFASREEADDVRFVSMLNDNVTILEATVTSESKGDVFSIVDNGKTHTLLSVEDGKLVFGDYTLCDYQGVAYIAGETASHVTAIYDDVNGTVRFAVDDKLACYVAGEITYEHLMIDGGVGNDAKLGTDGVTVSKMASTTSELVGYQKNSGNDTSVRFLSGVDTLYYTAIGFEVERDGVKLQKESNSPYVFTQVSVDGELEEATDYGYNYMTALIINEINTSGVIKVTPYVKVGDNAIYGVASYYKITVNGGLALEKTTEEEVSAATNADLASLTVDGDPVVGFSADTLNYNVPATAPSAMTIVAVAEEEGATVDIAQSGTTATVTVTSFNGKVKKVYTLTAYEKLASEVVNKNGANAIVTYVFDDGDQTTANIVTELSKTYDSLAGSFALITKNLATLSTVEGEEGDGLLEYEKDENGDYVYTKNEDNWTYWETLLGTYGSSGFEAVSHTHTHAYIGEDDNGGSFTYYNTNGDKFTSEVFPKGNVTKEYYASNQILRALGQRAYAMVGAGLTAGGYMIDYTDSYKALPQTSGAFIGKRTTYTNPTNPSTMVNAFDSFDNEDNRFNVLSYMVQHYNTSSTAPSSTSASTYSKDACLEAGIDYWKNYINTAVEQGGWAAFCFHNIRPDTHTGTTGHFVYQSQADALFSHTQTLSEENKVWVANLTDAMLYVFERSTSEVGAYVKGDGNVVVSLDDHEDDSIFKMALTVKVALPEGKTGASLNGEALTSFVENGVTYVYVDVKPGNSVTLTVA